jgi:hypothetical protein
MKLVVAELSGSCETCENEYSESVREPDMNVAKLIAISGCLLLSSSAPAQAPANSAPAAPVSYSSISELNQLIENLQNASQATQSDLSHMRVERWKADSATKRQTQNDTESILRNLQTALPTMLVDLKNSPENLALTFRTYRNLDALYDVLTSIVEAAGAFGSKEEFQSLNNDLGSIEGSRRAFADRMDKLANSKENEIGQLRTELQSARAAAAPPKKVVVDDTEPPPKKPPAKKKTPKASGQTAKPASTPPNSQ